MCVHVCVCVFVYMCESACVWVMDVWVCAHIGEGGRAREQGGQFSVPVMF